MKRRVIAGSIGAFILIVIAVVAIDLTRPRLHRRSLFRTTPVAKRTAPMPVRPSPVTQWSEQFRALEDSNRWADLATLLAQLHRSNPALYAQWNLGYLQSRALIENNDPRGAMESIAPFTAPGNPYRDLALFHRSEIGPGDAASRDRQTLIFGFPSASDREQAIDDETEHFSRLGDLRGLRQFAARLFASAPTERRRDLQAHVVELLVRGGDLGDALTQGMQLLRGGTTDDPADCVSRALDRPDLIRHMTAEQQAILGNGFFNHRHFDRAVALLSMALRSLPKKRDELLFAIGRSSFGDEKYPQAQQTYVGAANTTRDAKWKTEFLWQASRAAQLQGNDAMAESLMTAAIAVPGRFPATSAALTQRIRTRLKERRFAEAASDLAFLRKNWPRDHAVAEASIAYAVGMLGAGNDAAALATLSSIPRNLLDKFEPFEADYWRARALEASNLPAAFAAYLQVLRAPVPTHFAYFTRQRLDSPAMTQKLAREMATRDAQVPLLMDQRQFDLARRVETDRVLLSSVNRAAALNRLASIYRQIPAYRAVIDLRPQEFPRFPLPPNSDRLSQLLAMGLFDDAVDAIPRRYPLHPLSSALTQSLALNRGNASRESIYAVEVLMKSVPEDYLPELLPLTIRELLYPRYFYDAIIADAQHFGADPVLVVSIMREESRFNPRAKSQAAARGLLQFIITTARDVGRDIGLVNLTPEDLYDPRVIIRLGAKYVSALSSQFGNDDYKVAAAYNAGARQAALWARLSPAAGDDFFLSSINFDQTKAYVQKVMNSYRRYREIYGNAGPQGGLRTEN